jgi:MFS family permease
MESLKDVLNNIKGFLYAGMTHLPLSIGATMLIIGLFTGNYAMLFFLVGFLIITPFFAFLLNWLITIIPENWYGDNKVNPFKIMDSDICRVAVPFATLNNAKSEPEIHVISEWLAMMLFFFGYLIYNAVSLFAKVSDEKSDNSKVLKRKIQTMMSIASIGILLLVVLYYRFNTRCEIRLNGQLWPIIFAIFVCILFTFLGYGWYGALSSINESCFSDLFGIANRLIEPDVAAKDTRPVACVPSP